MNLPSSLPACGDSRPASRSPARTLVFRGDEYSYQAGAGVVADSVPQAEYEEVFAKSGSAARALAIAGEGL